MLSPKSLSMMLQKNTRMTGQHYWKCSECCIKRISTALKKLKAVFPSLDNFKYKDKWWVLDVRGNNLRVVAFIQFVNKRMYIKHIVNHADYDKLTRKHMKEKD